jgi:toxin FitB
VAVTRLLLDTSAVVDTIRQYPPTIAWLARQPIDAMFISTVTVGELYVGIYRQHSKDVDALERALDDLRRKTLAPFADRVLVFDTEAAEVWGRMTGLNAAKGGVIPKGDGMIAAIAIRHGMTVVTSDVHHFTHLVTMVNPRTA